MVVRWRLSNDQNVDRLKLLSDSLTVVGAIVAIYYLVLLTTTSLGNGADAYTYHGIRLQHPYQGWTRGALDAYQYSPAFAQLISPLLLLPVDAFTFVLRALSVVALVWLAGPLTLPVLLLGPVASEINAGNVNLLLASAIALSFRYPSAWSVVLLTKVTPGVGLLWFAVRREWRSLGVSLSATAVIGLVSFAIWPSQWIDWVVLITSHAGQAVPTFPLWLPLTVRLPIAVVIIVISAKSSQRWLMPIGATLAAPMLYFPTLAIAAGCLPAVRMAVGRRLAGFRGSNPPADILDLPGAVVIKRSVQSGRD